MANIVLFSGRAVRDAEVRYTQGEKAMCIAKFSLAVDRRGRGQGADFPNLVAFGKTAEFCEKYVKKGTGLIIQAHYQSGNYTNKEGQKVYTHDFVIDDIQFSGSKSDSQSGEKTEGKAASKPETAEDFMSIPDGVPEDLPFN